MKTVIVACSVRGYELGKELAKNMSEDDPGRSVSLVVKCKSIEDSIEETLTEYIGKVFCEADNIIFIAACGIAVRAIAPYIGHKSKDPAVLAMDETGRYCVSLLSGHAGGANELAEYVGELIGATPVITTATDNEGKFAVDEFARKNNLVIGNWKLAKEVSVRILEDENVYFCSDLPVAGILPEGLIAITPEELYGISMEKLAVHVTNENEVEEISEKYGDDLQILKLVPRNIVVGIGCRKNTSAGKIRKAIESCMDEYGLDMKSIYALASIELKKDEEGILTYCSENDVEFITYSPDELDDLEGEFSESEFVENITGVSNVCERCAVMLAKRSEQDEIEADEKLYDDDEESEEISAETGVPECLICQKKVYDGVTIALAEIDCEVCF